LISLTGSNGGVGGCGCGGKTLSTSIAYESTADCSWFSSSITFVARAGGGDEAATSFFASCFLKGEAISPFLFIVQLFYRVKTKYESASIIN
jgi:hypothetical protein